MRVKDKKNEQHFCAVSTGVPPWSHQRHPPAVTQRSATRLWILLIESKRAAALIEVGLPQLLASMLASPNPGQPVYSRSPMVGVLSFSSWCKAQIPRAIRCPASLRCAIQGMTCPPFWQRSNTSGTWCYRNNLMSGKGYRATYGTSGQGWWYVTYHPGGLPLSQVASA